MSSEAIRLLNELITDLEATGWTEQRPPLWNGWNRNEARKYASPGGEAIVWVSMNPPDVQAVHHWRGDARGKGAAI